MTKKSRYGMATCDPHPDQSKITGEVLNQQRKLGRSNGSGTQAPAKSWKRYLKFLPKFHTKMKHKKPSDDRAPNGFKPRSARRCSRTLLKDCGNLVRVIRRTAADCFAAAMAPAAGEEDDLPCYMQLDQVNYGVKREAFGPIYLVT